MKRILVIDDEAQTRDVLRQFLERAGYEIVEACDGREGIQHYRALPADLVITDLLMPGQEGLETIRELRRLTPEVKILALSGGGRTGQLDFLPVAAQLGAQETLRKPLRRQALLDAVRRLLPES